MIQWRFEDLRLEVVVMALVDAEEEGDIAQLVPVEEGDAFPLETSVTSVDFGDCQSVSVVKTW